MTKKSTHVAIALIRYKNQILIGWRDEKLHQGGCYEFPGGKVEKDETAEQAVQREVLEEVGIAVAVAQLYHTKHFDYGDKEVFLEFFLCEPTEQAAQQISDPWQWVSLHQLASYTFPAANQSIVERLNWSQTLAITAYDTNLETQQPKAGMCYLRKNYQSIEDIQKDLNLLAKHNIKAILNLKYFQQLDQIWQDQIFAIHFNQQQLIQENWHERYPQHNLIAACHDSQDLQQAYAQKCSAVFLSPIQATATHPEQPALGWEVLEAWCKQTSLPVYALGGMQLEDLAKVILHGAYGVAGIRAFF